MKCSKCRRREVEDPRYKLCEQCREYNRKYDREYNQRPDVKEHAREYHQRPEIVERNRELQRKRYWRDPEKHRKRARGYHQIHTEQCRERCRRWHTENIEYAHMSHQQWKKENPEKNRINENNRRARKQSNGGVLPENVADILFTEQNGLCYLCGDLLYGRFDDPVCIEHKTPLSRGGANDISNVGLAHLSCNSKKFTMTYDEFVNKVKKNVC